MTSYSGSLLPAVSSILPVIPSAVINDILTSTLGQAELASSPAVNVLSPEGEASGSKSVPTVDAGDSDDDSDGDDSSIESHGGGTVTPTRKKG